MRMLLFAIFLLFYLTISPRCSLAQLYLNNDNLTVAIGTGATPGDFHNTFNSGRTIEKVIDASSADAQEIHRQGTHIWYTAHDRGGFTAEESLLVDRDYTFNGDVNGFDFRRRQRGEPPNSRSLDDRALRESQYGAEPLAAYAVAPKPDAAVLFLIGWLVLLGVCGPRRYCGDRKVHSASTHRNRMASAVCFALPWAIGLGLPSLCSAAFQFTKVVEEDVTPAPLPGGGTDGVFTLINTAPAIDGNRIVFPGVGGSVSTLGIYTATLAGAVEPVVTRAMQIPDQPVGVNFLDYDQGYADISGDEVAFFGANQGQGAPFGIYKRNILSASNPIVTVINENTLVPGAPAAEFTTVSEQMSFAEGVIAFSALTVTGGFSDGRGYYKHSGGGLERVLHISPLAGVGSTLVSTDGTNIVYSSKPDGDGPFGLRRFDGGASPSTLLAIEGQPLPDGDGEFGGNYSTEGSNAVIDGDLVFFRDSIAASPTGSDTGVFLHNGASLEIIAREGDPAPGSPGETFTSLGHRVTMEGGHYAFTARVSGDSFESLYSNFGGSLQPVISVGDTIGAAVVEGVLIQRGSLDGNRIAFFANTTEGDAIYVATFIEFGADTEPDGDVDGADFLAIQRTNPGLIAQWVIEFSQGVPMVASSQTIPEPSSLLLLLLAFPLAGAAAIPARRDRRGAGERGVSRAT